MRSICEFHLIVAAIDMSMLIFNMSFNTMGLKDVLEANKVPLPPDFDERFNLVMLGLRRDPKFNSELQKFKNKQDGGLKIPSFAKGLKANIPATTTTPISMAPPMDIDSEDWMGPRIKWFLDAITSPYVRVMLRGLFMVIFFVSYLEAIPVFGNILSVGLDIMVTGSKIITKSVQKQIPFFMGLIPIPYASLIGLIMAAIYGAMVWPMIAMVAFSRQDFTAAIESFLRAIPPPAGDMIADLFLEGNRFVAKMEAKRQKVANDIIKAIATIATILETVSNQVQSGISKVSENVNRVAQMKDQSIDSVNVMREQAANAVDDVKQTAFSSNLNTLTNNIQEAAELPKEPLKPVELPKEPPPPPPPPPKRPPPPPPPPKKPRASFAPTPVGKGRKRLSTRRHKTSKWMTTRRRKSATH